MKTEILFMEIEIKAVWLHHLALTELHVGSDLQ